MRCIILIIMLVCILSEASSQEQVSLKYSANSTKSEAGNTLVLGSILILTPTLVLQDSRAYFGFSKELSLGKFPYGRAEFDYTFVFRSERNSLFHLSYNLDIPLNFDFRQSSIFMLSPGAGYYTDLTDKGYFVQLAFGVWASTGLLEGLSIHPNIKFRNVFKQNGKPGLFEASLGVGFGFYSR